MLDAFMAIFFLATLTSLISYLGYSLIAEKVICSFAF